MPEKIIIGNIPIEVTKKKIKNLHLRVHAPQGQVRMTAPAWMNISAIEAFALSKLDWIVSQQQKLQAQAPVIVQEYITGEKHEAWGRSYLLKVIERNELPSVKLVHDEMYLYIRPGTNHQRRRAIIEHWYRTELKQLLPTMIAKWEPILNVKVHQFLLKKMKTRWGSCSPHSAVIRFNTELAKKPVACLEYIVVHEMVHLLEASHNHRFKALMHEFMPKWRYHREQLNCHKLLPEQVDC